MNVPKISTGAPSTLATYRSIALALTGSEKSKAVQFFDKKIAESSGGEHSVVIQQESQMMTFIAQMIK